jgi:PfaD family protein
VVVEPRSGRRGVGLDGELALDPAGWPVLAHLPPMFPEWLGDRGFTEMHEVRFPYVVGAMAGGIATPRMVRAAAEAGFLAFFGAAGLDLERVERALDALEDLSQRGLAWGSNLIHSPSEPALEAAVVDLYLRRGVKRVSASAYMDLTPALVRFAASGLAERPDGSIHRERHVFAKISRPEVAARFLAPPPDALLERLVREGALERDEARLARHLPIAEDVTVEADSGGHTDNQALAALFPTIARLRDRALDEHRFPRPIRVGAAGGLGTPAAVASAFGLGAAYVLTGSVNQACTESGLAASGRELLARAELPDVTMAPAADMFEMGVEVQVLKRGTMFASRGHLLRTLYRAHPSLEAIPADARARIERSCFRKPLEEAWADTRAYWLRRDPREVARAEEDPKHKMALLFRAYLGQASRWAIDGRAERVVDFQIWCGPAMGAFNDWARGSFLEPPSQRTVAQVGLNLLEGAAVITRAHQLRAFGVPVPPAAFDFAPRPLDPTPPGDH